MTLKLYEALANDGVVFEMHNSPILFLFLTRRAQAALLEDLELMTEYGYSSPHRLSAKDVRDLEPQVTNEVIGGVLSAGEAYLRPETLIAGLAERLTQSGVEIREGINVAGFRCHGRSVVALTTSSGELEGDQFLLTAGAWSGQLCRHLGIRIPIQGGKGYTITIADPIPSVNLPTYLEEAKVAYSPFSNALRIGGTMEFSVLDQSIDRRRIAAIKQSTTHFLRTWPTGSSERVWAGLRPLTPDGLPVVGQLPGYDNLFIAAGHGMLGVTLGPSTALAISQLMSRGASEFDIEVFSPSRFR
jgi:D-amino-acid dehydrogenase